MSKRALLLALPLPSLSVAPSGIRFASQKIGLNDAINDLEMIGTPNDLMNNG